MSSPEPSPTDVASSPQLALTSEPGQQHQQPSPLAASMLAFKPRSVNAAGSDSQPSVDEMAPIRLR